MRKPNYVLKAKILNSPESRSELLKVGQYRKEQYLRNKLTIDENGELIKENRMPDDWFFNLQSECQNFENLREYDRINHSFYERRKRLYNRISNMLLEGRCIFVTLTFRDDILENTTPEQRRTRVSRYLKSNSVKFVGNIDFGAENGREHYHAVCLVYDSDIPSKAWNKQNGNVNFEVIRFNNENPLDDRTEKKLSKYIAKLSNHAIKNTTKRSTLLYSR